MTVSFKDRVKLGLCGAPRCMAAPVKKKDGAKLSLCEKHRAESKIAGKKHKEKRRALGLCRQCGANSVRIKANGTLASTCEKCGGKDNSLAKNQYMKKRLAGVCVSGSCGIATKGKLVYCDLHSYKSQKSSCVDHWICDTCRLCIDCVYCRCLLD